MPNIFTAQHIKSILDIFTHISHIGTPCLDAMARSQLQIHLFALLSYFILSYPYRS